MRRNSGATRAPNMGQYQWAPHSRRPLVLGSEMDGHMARLVLNEIRWRKSPRESVLRIFSGVLAIVLHLLFFAAMLLVRPSGYQPSAGNPDQKGVINVRFINKKKPEPVPPPPPIQMPERKVKHVERHVPRVVKQAPVAAMPPVPTQPLAAPKVTVTPGKTHVGLTPSKPVAPHATVSPSTATQPTVSEPSPTRIVEEMSRQAIPAPKLQAIKVTPVKAPSHGHGLQPIPSTHEAPVVTLGQPDLNVNVSAPTQAQLQAPTNVTATAPSVPSVTMAPTVQQVTPAPTPTPSIATQVQAPQMVKAPNASLAPIPQVPVTASASALNLPTANVSVPQAPQVEAPSVQVQMPSVTAANSSQPAQAASAATPKVSSAPTSGSWAPANDQFKPLTGNSGSKSQASTNQSKKTGGVVQLMPRGNSDVMTRSSDHLGYKSTIFDQYWAPANESILDTFLRHLIEKLTVTHTFELAPGVRVKCALGPMAIFFACGPGDQPRAKSAKSDDPRLDMAPARSLVPGMNTPASTRSTTAPTLQLNNKAKCATARVAGAPLPPGCPGAPIKPSQSDRWDLSGNGK